MQKRNRTYLETVMNNPKQFAGDVLFSAPKNKEDLKRNLRDYNENLMMMFTGNFKRRYPPKGIPFNPIRDRYKAQQYYKKMGRR